MMFYLTLPSNSSLQYYPENTLTHFTTQLAQPVNLQGQWEVGLAEIQYPHTWHNLTEKEGLIFLRKQGGEKILKLPAGEYDTPEELIAGLNQLFEEKQPPYTVRTNTLERTPLRIVTLDQLTYETPRPNESAMIPNQPDVVFSYHPITKKASIKIQPHCEMVMSPTLKIMLGMHESHMAEGTHEGIHVVDVSQGFYSLYVYCNLIEPRPVGDSSVPLLRIVPIEGRNGQMITKVYQHIQYLPLLQKHFSTIEIDIKKDTGERVPFELGKLVVTLHFRKQRPYL